jgi:hypothetical protein
MYCSHRKKENREIKIKIKIKTPNNGHLFLSFRPCLMPNPGIMDDG